MVLPMMLAVLLPGPAIGAMLCLPIFAGSAYIAVRLRATGKRGPTLLQFALQWALLLTAGTLVVVQPPLVVTVPCLMGAVVVAGVVLRL